MKIEIFPDAAAASQRAADCIAESMLACVTERGRFVMALSGGAEPWQAFRMLASKDLPWSSVHVLQVDERVVPAGHTDRNDTHLRESLIDRVRIPPDQMHSMPVEDPNLDAATERYAGLLQRIGGTPPVIDLLHLGLGQDGHTASLAPGDPVVDERGRDVALTREFRGHRRMTLTLPAINRARRILWLVVGARKADALARLLAGHSPDPAGRVREDVATLIADRAALPA